MKAPFLAIVNCFSDRKMAKKPCRNGPNCRNRQFCRFEHEPSQAQFDVQVDSICTLKLSNSTIFYFFSASFRTYLEDARDQIAPISTLGDQLKQVKARELSETDFREARQGLQERMTGVLQKIGRGEEPSGTLRTCMRCIAQKAIRAGKVLAHSFYALYKAQFF